MSNDRYFYHDLLLESLLPVDSITCLELYDPECGDAHVYNCVRRCR